MSWPSVLGLTAGDCRLFHFPLFLPHNIYKHAPLTQGLDVNCMIRDNVQNLLTSPLNSLHQPNKCCTINLFLEVDEWFLCPCCLQVPEYLTVRQTRRSSSRKLYLRRPNTEFYKKSFEYSTAKLWNSLPSSIRTLTDIGPFTRAAKLF